MEKTRYKKIINYNYDLYNKIIALKKRRDRKRKIQNFLNRKFHLQKGFPIINIDKTPILNRVKQYLDVDDEKLNSLIEEYSALNILDQNLSSEEIKEFWFSDNVKVWLIKNIITQFGEDFVYSFMLNYFGDKKIKLMDYACGSATLSFSLMDKLNIEKLDLFELDNYIGNYLKQNSDNKIKYYDILKDEMNNQYDAILSIDVLEHLENPSETLIKMHKALKKGGILVLHAPFELDDPSHIPEAADDFFNKNGFNFLNKNFKLIYDRQNEFLISAIYQKK